MRLGVCTPEATPHGLRDGRGIAAAGIDEVHAVPLRDPTTDPVGFARELGTHVVGRLSRI